MPREVFVAGQVLTAAELNVVSDQSVMVFAGAAARGSAIPSPTEGMVTYREDDDVVEVFDGSVFAPVGVEPAILQVVSTTKTDTFTTTSTSFVDITGLTASITPSSSANKILVYGMVTGSQDVGLNDLDLQISRGGTAIGVGDASGSRLRATARLNVGNIAWSGSAILLFTDSPATTSSTTYALQAQATGGGTVFINRSENDSDGSTRPRTISTIVLMEVAG